MPLQIAKPSATLPTATGSVKNLPIAINLRANFTAKRQSVPLTKSTTAMFVKKVLTKCALSPLSSILMSKILIAAMKNDIHFFIITNYSVSYEMDTERPLRSL